MAKTDDIEAQAAQAEAEFEAWPADLEPVVLFAQRYPLLTIAITAAATALLIGLLRPPPARR